jgi:hypothetical protein
MPNPLDFTPSKNALYDASQGASRAFWAGGAGAPVDMFTGLLNAPLMLGGYVGNKLGLLSGNQMPQPITKPVGGSEWLAEKMRAMGLLQDAPGTVADEWGQAVGGLLGPVAAAKAPQIATMANRGMANLAAPAAMNKQMGAIVYHGSPHKFDKFDSTKIGSGEGAQAYGHGVYLADRKSVAEYYKAALSNSPQIKNRQSTWGELKFIDSNGDSLSGESLFRAMYSPGAKVSGQKVVSIEESASGPIALLQNKYGKTSPYPYDKNRITDPFAVSAAVPRNWVRDMGDGAIYKVDLPDTAIAKMLNWDKPLSQQAPEVKSALSSMGVNVDSKMTGGEWHNQAARGLASGNFKAGRPDIAAQLKNSGIPGIRYLDGGSRGAGTGTSNYVVLPGEESALKILERNGRGLLSP